MTKTDRMGSGVADVMLSVAGEGFALSARGVGLAVEEDPAYAEFLKTPPTPSATCRIDLTVGDVVVPSSDRLMFETDELWKLYKDSEGYAFVLSRSLELPEPYLIARYDDAATCVSVTCSEACLREEASTPTIGNPLRYPLDQLLVNLHFAVHRSGLLVHGAGVCCDGRGVMLCGKSGAGKTTISRILAEYSGLDVLSDDRMLIKPDHQAYRMWGTPWPGEGGFAVNDMAELRGLCFLEHGKDHAIELITAQQALDRLLPVASVPWYDEELMVTTLDMVECLLESTPSYVLRFAPDKGVAELVESLVLAG